MLACLIAHYGLGKIDNGYAVFRPEKNNKKIVYSISIVYTFGSC